MFVNNVLNLPCYVYLPLPHTFHTHTTHHTLPSPPHRVNHSKNAIVKPQGPTAQETKRDVDEAMKRVKEAMMAIEASVVVPEVQAPVATIRRPPRSRSRYTTLICLTANVPSTDGVRTCLYQV